MISPLAFKKVTSVQQLGFSGGHMWAARVRLSAADSPSGSHDKSQVYKAQLKPSLGGLYSPWLFGDLQLAVQGPHDESHTRMMDGQGQDTQLMNEPQTKQWLFVTLGWPLAVQGHFPSTESGCFSCSSAPTLTNIALSKGTPSQKLVTT